MSERMRGKMGMGRGFTLVELLVGTTLVGIGGASLQPVLFGARGTARDNTCKMNMMMQGQMYAAYASGHGGQIASYTWQGHETYKSKWISLQGPHPDDWRASQAQLSDLLRRSTGRGTDIITNWLTHPQRRYTHLVLLDAYGIAGPQELFACPEDAPLLASQADPLDESLWAHRGLYGASAQFNADQVRQRYPYSSTYQTIPNASAPEGIFGNRAMVAPSVETTHLFESQSFFPGVCGRRSFGEVAFPSLKVHTFEHNDFHRNTGDPFYAYEQAECNQLFFDGSVDDLRSGDAEPGWDPNNPDDPGTFYYRYTPLSTEPIPLGDPGALLPVGYRFTREGLGGFDYVSRMRFKEAPAPVRR